MMNEPTRGMVVMGPTGQLGMVDEVIYESTGELSRIVVRRENGEAIVLQPGTYHVDRGTLRLSTGGGAVERETLFDSTGSGIAAQNYRSGQQMGAAGSVETVDVRPGEGMVIPVIREEVTVTRREVERGGVRVHKRVEEREELVEEPAFREEVIVERVAVGRPIDQEIG